MQCAHLSVALLDGAEGPFPSHVSIVSHFMRFCVKQLFIS